MTRRMTGKLIVGLFLMVLGLLHLVEIVRAPLTGGELWVRLVIVLAEAGVGASLVFAHHSSQKRIIAQNEKEQRERLSNQVLRLAERRGGQVTLLEVAITLEQTPDQAAELLEELARTDHVEVEVSERRGLVYSFHGLYGTSGPKQSEVLPDEPYFDPRYSQEVVGESYYQPQLRGVLATHGNEVDVLLKPEPENPYDSNAVAVLGPGQHKLGHLPREQAARWHSRIPSSGLEVRAKLFGGTEDKPSIGVWLDIVW